MGELNVNNCRELVYEWKSLALQWILYEVFIVADEGIMGQLFREIISDMEYNGGKWCVVDGYFRVSGGYFLDGQGEWKVIKDLWLYVKVIKKSSTKLKINRI